MRRALIIVDVQNDFLPGGALAVPDGDLIIPVILKLARLSRYDLKVATQDWHPASHMSFASNHEGQVPFNTVKMPYGPQTLWPDHCVQHESGAQIALPQHTYHTVIQKGTSVAVDSYSGFYDNDRKSQTKLDHYLTMQNITHLEIVGLALDYCVKYTALDAVKLGYDVTLISDATKAIGSPGETLVELVEAGVTIRPSTRLA